MTLTTLLASVNVNDFSNELCGHGERESRCNAKQRSRLIDEAIAQGFTTFRGRQARFVTYARGCIPDTDRAESLRFDLERGTVEVSISELTEAGRAA